MCKARSSFEQYLTKLQAIEIVATPFQGPPRIAAPLVFSAPEASGKEVTKLVKKLSTLGILLATLMPKKKASGAKANFWGQNRGKQSYRSPKVEEVYPAFEAKRDTYWCLCYACGTHTRAERGGIWNLMMMIITSYPQVCWKKRSWPGP